MGTFVDRYHASKDRERFNTTQSRAEQINALRNLDYFNGGITGEYGQLIELRLAILRDGETLPGRTAQESLKMVEETIARARRQARRQPLLPASWFRFLLALCALLTLLALVHTIAPLSL